MLNYKILESKPKVTRNGEEFIDLLPKTYSRNDEDFSGFPLVVNKYYVGRPDLISLAVYGDDIYGDIICKVNGISNPFELNENDTLIIPSIEYVTSHVGKEVGNSTFIEDEKTDEISNKIAESFQKKPLEKRTQNEQLVGERNYVIDRSLGLVFY